MVRLPVFVLEADVMFAAEVVESAVALGSRLVTTEGITTLVGIELVFVSQSQWSVEIEH